MTFTKNGRKYGFTKSNVLATRFIANAKKKGKNYRRVRGILLAPKS